MIDLPYVFTERPRCNVERCYAHRLGSQAFQ